MICFAQLDSQTGRKLFEKHQNTLSHHEAVDYVVKIPSTSRDVGKMLSADLANVKAENRKTLRVIFSSIRFLSRQGLALRGRFKAGENSEKRAEFDLNLIQLLRTRGEDDPAILQWLQRSQDKFTSLE